jgi:hypothetical protein
VIGCAILNRAMWWGALEVAALIWIVPAAILPQFQAFLRRRGGLAGA